MGIPALVLVAYVSAFCHELGHALVGQLNGFVITSFGVGLRKPLWNRQFHGTRVFLGWSWFGTSAITLWYYPDWYPSKRRQVWAYAGGVIAQMLLAGIAIGLYFLLPHGKLSYLCLGFFVVNGPLALINLIPLRVPLGASTLHSDGAHMLLALLGRSHSMSMPMRIRFTRSLRVSLLRIGDMTALYIWLCQAAAAWLELGCTDRARVLCEEAESLPAVNHNGFTRGFGAIVRALVFCQAGDLQQASTSIAEAERECQQAGCELGLFHVELARAWLLSRQGESSRAMAQMEELAARPLATRERTVKGELLCLRVQTLAKNSEDFRMVLQAYEYETPPVTSDARDLRIYTALGGAYARRKSWKRAESAYQRALAAASKIYLEFSEQDDSAVFLQAQASLLADAGTCFRQLGNEKEASRAGSLFQQALEESKAKAAALARLWDKRLQWCGLGLTFFNLLVVLTTIAIFLTFPRQPSSHVGNPHAIEIILFMFFVVMMVPLTAISILQILVSFLVHLFRSSTWRYRGKVTLFLSILPWIVLLIIAPMAYFAD